MRKVWVVVANSSISKIYRAEDVNHLIEHKVFEHPESHMKPEDLISDNQGRTTNRGLFGSDTMEETPPKLKEALHFAEEISQFLKNAYNNKEYERLYIISKPPFLGYLRKALHANVANVVQAEISKDLTSMKAEEIREYLPPVL